MRGKQVLELAQLNAVIGRKPRPGVEELLQLFLMRGADAIVVMPPAKRQRAQGGEDGDENKTVSHIISTQSSF
jgi:hypothetical protein